MLKTFLLPTLAGIVAAAAILYFMPQKTEENEIYPIFKEDLTAGFNYAIERSAPSVVNIYIKESNKKDGKEEKPVSASGIIMTENGYILTNYHVVMSNTSPDDNDIRVQLRNGVTFNAKLIGYDRRTDIAVLKVESRYKLPSIPTNPRLKNRLGDIVLAIGNPYNLGQTITHGIISAVGRTGSGMTNLNNIDLNVGIQDLIQTDAPINYGNSGGALVNSLGEFVGMSTATLSDSSDAKAYGISFAIPSSQALRILNEIIKNGHVTRGYLGIAADNISTLSSEIQNKNNTSNYYGIIIKSIDPNGPSNGILEPFDIVETINNTTVQDLKNAMDLIADSAPGTDIKFIIIRNGKRIQETVRVGEQISE